MTDEQIRIAVAEEMGWRDISNSTNWIIDPFGNKQFFRFGQWWGDVVPDYPNSLDACAEFEARLSEKEVVFYLTKLLQVRYRTGADHGMIACMQDKLTFATARQRCEAFLRLRGRWKEDEK